MIGQQLDLFTPVKLGVCYAIYSGKGYWTFKANKGGALVFDTKVFGSLKEANKQLSLLLKDKSIKKKYRLKVVELKDWEIEHLKESAQIDRESEESLRQIQASLKIVNYQC